MTRARELVVSDVSHRTRLFLRGKVRADAVGNSKGIATENNGGHFSISQKLCTICFYYSEKKYTFRSPGNIVARGTAGDL